MGNRRFISSLLLAAGLHGAALWLWPVPQRNAPPPAPLEITIELERKTAPPADPIPPIPTPDVVPIPATVAERQSVSRRAASEPAPESSIAAAEPEETPAKPVLDLTRPEQWENPVSASAVDRLVYAFRPELYEGVNARRSEQMRRQLLDERRIAVAGRTPDEYNAIDPDPFRLKTEQGCFELRNELDGRVIGDLRWWRVSCNEILENPLLLPALEYDALGRAVANEL